MTSLRGAILSCRCNGRWCLSEGCEAPRAWIFSGELTIRVPALPIHTWDKLFLPGDIYPMVEPSWHLGVHSALEYILSDVYGFLQLRLFMPSTQGNHSMRPQGWQCLSIAVSPRACLTGGPGLCPGSTREAGWVDRW
jgi:hypothetical protein